MEKAAEVKEIKFGTDGWRGIMARDFTMDNVRRVAQAVSDYLKEETGKPPAQRRWPLSGPVLVGYDRRFASEMFAREIARVVCGNGFKTVLSAEVFPTPALSFLTKRHKGLGLMVTASHNPHAYNGIKIKMDGRAAQEDVTAAVESWLGKSRPARASDFEEKSFRAPYVQYLKSRVNVPAIKSRLNRPVVVDYLYGASAGFLEEILSSKRLSVIHGERDPLFGGLHPEPVEAYLEDLKRAVREKKALIGIALDGDGDRVGMVDENGKYYTPCQVFPMIVEYLIEKKKIRGKIVQSVSMGYLSKRMAKARGLDFEELPVGFKHVAERIASGAAAIGGEESGGYAWKGGIAERDGLLTGLLLLEMCLSLKKTPSQILGGIEAKHGKSCFKRLDLRLGKPVADKAVFAAKIVKRLPKKIAGSEIKELVQIDGLKIILSGDEWILIRPSGTEPLLRLYAESDSPKKTQDMLDLARKWAAPGISIEAVVA
ncbi:MAG: phosphohexomutase domain-containing protein [Elusimicrobiota bacterium]